jgi:hypothetical protein
VLIFSNCSAQQFRETNAGINIGIVTAIGTKFDRFGVSVNGYYAKNNFQVNGGLRFYFNFKNIGPDKQYFEAVSSLGIVYGYGQSTSDTSLFFNPVGNQTFKQNSFGYAFNYYINSINSSQQTGTISIQVNSFSFIAENDIFARPKLDRFRTGAFLIQYQRSDFALGLNTTLFTGEMGQKVRDEGYPYSHLYKNNVAGTYTKSSDGLLSLQGQFVTEYYQQIQGNIGIDSERVRHVVQNRLIHDMIFLPKKWRKQNAAHIPMLDENNGQYLFRENQNVQKLKFYFNGFSNSGLFY